MATTVTQSHDKRLTYKTHLSLFPLTWRKLEIEANRRHITGRELIQALLTQWGASKEALEGAASEPLKQPVEDEAYWLSLSSQVPDVE